MPPKIRFDVKIEGVRETLRALTELGPEANEAIRTHAGRLAGQMADRARLNAVSLGHQAALMAPTVKVRRDRLPAIQAGGSMRVGHLKSPAWGLLAASEFGMNRHSGWYAKPRYDADVELQYHAHTGRVGAWFFPTVEQEGARITEAWEAAADEVIRKFGE